LAEITSEQVAGNGSEWVAGSESESLAGNVGIRKVFPLAEVTAAIRDAIDRGAISFDAVKMITLCRIEKRPVKLDMTAYPYLAKATVKSTSPRDYLTLVGKEAA
jgi:hypothetical protein